MYTSHIGKKFFERYKKRFKVEIGIVQFFDEVFYPLFFRDKRYLIWVANSPFAQKPVVKQVESGKWTVTSKDTFEIFDIEPTISQMRNVQLLELKRKFTSENPDMSFIPGYFTADDTIDTSGMVSNTGFQMEIEDMYASWIGYCCAIKEEKSYALYIENELVFDALWDGWQEYRIWLTQTPAFKGNDVQQWNSQWVYHKLTNGDDKSFIPAIEGDSIKGVTWTKLLFSLSIGVKYKSINIYANRHIADKQKYVTLGFIEFHLKPVERIYDLYKTLFPSESITPKRFAELYETDIGFARACENGSIGLRQLEPKDLKKYFSGNEKIPSTKEYEKNKFNFQLYYIWIIAMLNNKEFLELAEETAKALHTYTAGGQRGKATRGNEVNAVLECKSKRAFADALVTIVEEDASVAPILNKTLDALHLNIPSDNVLYFITLVKFKYALPEQLLNN